jgi:mono/diheme cytochrome c family protein
MALAVAVAPPSRAQTEADGEKVFKTVCFACHTIGGGRLVGPDLAGVQDRHSAEWLRSFIRSSQKMVDEGDAKAVALFDEYKIPMPDNALDDAAIDGVIAYIAQAAGGSGDAEPAAPPPPARAATEADVELGRRLFQGTTRLAGGGPACNSCHHVQNDAVIGGGTLAKDLTTVFTRMGTPGVEAILGSPPFPVMKTAYSGRPLEADEVFALSAFLEVVDGQSMDQPSRDYGFRLLYSGIGGAGLLFGLYGLLGMRRKRGSMNQELFDRQVRSQ